MLTRLKNLSALLDTINEGAARAQESTQTLVTTTTAAAASSVSALQSVSSVLSSVSVQTLQTTQTVQTALTDMHTQTEATQTQIATRLDDLQDAVANHANLWNKAVSELIDAVKIGAVPIQQLITLYGDAQIGGQRLREYLDGLDFNFYQNKVHDLITGLQNGTVEIAQVQDYLGKTQLLFAKQLADVIELFRKGAVTLKRVEEIVKDIQKAFPQSDFADLAQALADALRNGG